MPWSLEIITGSRTGLRTPLPFGATITIGSGEHASVRLLDDPGLSPIHLAISLDAGRACFAVIPEDQSIVVNGAAARAGLLGASQQFQAGSTAFILHPPPPSPFPAVFRVGSWGFETIPDGWLAVEGSGFQRPEEKSFQASIMAFETMLPENMDFESYVTSQCVAVSRRIRGIEVGRPELIDLRGGEQSVCYRSTSTFFEEVVMHEQIYSLSGAGVGLLTFTRLAKQDEALRETWAAVRRGLSYFVS